jgi:hypothetical protein
MFGFKMKICNPGNYRILFRASLNIDLPGREPGWLFSDLPAVLVYVAGFMWFVDLVVVIGSC